VPAADRDRRCGRRGEGLGVAIIADGGIKYSGDVAKGSPPAPTPYDRLAIRGTDEAPARSFSIRVAATNRIAHGLDRRDEGSSKDRYFQADIEMPQKLVPRHRGPRAVQGPLRESIYQLVGGLRASWATRLRDDSGATREGEVREDLGVGAAREPCP